MSSRIAVNSVFSPSERLKNCFSSSPDIENVLKSSEASFSVTERAKQLLQGRWYVCHVVSEPFRKIAVFFLQKLSLVVLYFQLKTIERKIKVAITYLQNGFLETRLANFHITDAINHCNERVGFPGSINEEILSGVQRFYLSQGVIKWAQLKEGGVCAGSSLWFIYLYLKTREAFKDPQAHAAALGSLFVKGAGKEASLLQLFELERRVEYLSLKIDTKNRDVDVPFFEQTSPLATYSLRTNDLQNSDHQEKLAKHLNGLPNGNYVIILPGHAAACIKMDKYLYFFEPNLGVYFFSYKPSKCGLILHGLLKIFSKSYEVSALEISSKKILEIYGASLSSQQLRECMSPGLSRVDFISISEDSVQNIGP
jgi:hypothetical protein